MFDGYEPLFSVVKCYYNIMRTAFTCLKHYFPTCISYERIMGKYKTNFVSVGIWCSAQYAIQDNNRMDPS